MIVRTDAVVLRAFDYGETSRIVALLTRRHGVLSVLAKGARRPTSKFGATLQPLSYVQVVYYFKPGRGLQTLSESAHVQRFARLAADLTGVTLGLRMLELVRALLQEGEEHPQVLHLLAQTLAWLDDALGEAATAGRGPNALPWFQLRLASLLGFAPDLRREDVLALGDDGGALLLDSGVVAPAEYGGRTAARASRGALRAFAVLARADLAVAGRMRLDPETRAEVEGLADSYLRYHTEDAFPGRVRRVTDQIERGLERERDAPWTPAPSGEEAPDTSAGA